MWSLKCVKEQDAEIRGLQSSTKSKPHGSSDFTLFYLVFLNKSLLFLKSHQIHAACFQVKTVVSGVIFLIVTESKIHTFLKTDLEFTGELKPIYSVMFSYSVGIINMFLFLFSWKTVNIFPIRKSISKKGIRNMIKAKSHQSQNKKRFRKHFNKFSKINVFTSKSIIFEKINEGKLKL